MRSPPCATNAVPRTRTTSWPEAAAEAKEYMPNYLAWMRTWEWFKDQGVKPEHFVLSGLGQQLINR